MHRSHGAAGELAADQDVVRRRHVHHLFGVGLVPLSGLGGEHGGDAGEVAHDEAQGVDDVPVGDGQRVRTEARVALPGAAGWALQRAVTHAVGMARQHLAHETRFDLLLHVEQGGAHPRLQAARRLHVSGAGQRGQLFRFGGGAAERPFGVDVLAGFDRRPGRLVVRRHAHHHGHRVDLIRYHHLPEIGERQLRAERLARRFRGLASGGADRRQLDIGARQQRRKVRLRGPGRTDVGSDESQANPICHETPSSSRPRALGTRGLCEPRRESAYGQGTTAALPDV